MGSSGPETYAHVMIQTSLCIVFDNTFLTCTLYLYCFILSFASNRREMVPACFVAGVVKHWMQTDVHVHVS